MNRTLGPRPRLDLLESPSAYELFAAVPDGGPRGVDVDFAEGILRLELQPPAPESAARPARLIAHADVPRGWRISVGFGDLVSGDGIRAVHAGGVLHVHLPKPAPQPAPPRER